MLGAGSSAAFLIRKPKAGGLRRGRLPGHRGREWGWQTPSGMGMETLYLGVPRASSAVLALLPLKSLPNKKRSEEAGSSVTQRPNGPDAVNHRRSLDC